MLSSRIVLVLGLAAGLAGPVRAETTYRLAVTGQIDHTVDCWESDPLCSGPPHVYSAWTGTVTIVVDSAADGTYQGPALESLAFVANIGSFSVTPFADDPAFSVTIVDGQVSSLDTLALVETPHDTSAFTHFGGLDAGYDATGGTHYGGTVATGTLSAIPEPAPAALLLVGLAAMAGLARRRQACINGQRGLTSNA